MNQPVNVVPMTSSAPPPQHGGSSGNGGNFGERLARVEAHMAYLATKEDVSKIETLIERKEASRLRWLVGVVSVSAVSLVVALARTFW